MKDAEAELKSTNNNDIIPENVEKEINKNKGVVKPDDALGKDLYTPFLFPRRIQNTTKGNMYCVKRK